MSIQLAGHTQLSHRSTDSYWKTPIGYRKDGRPIFPMGGGADDDDDDNDDDLDLPDDDDSDDDDDNDDDADLSDAEKKLLKKLDKSLGTRLDAATQKIADRLVQAQQTRERKAAREKQRSGASSSTSARQQEAREREVQSDIREGRGAFREAFADHGLRGMSPEERTAASKLGRALVESAVRGGADPDDAGLEAAKTVADTLKGIRKSAETSVMAKLKKQGVDLSKLGTERQQPVGQPGRSSTAGKTVGAQVRAGEERAQRLVPGRVLQPKSS